MSFGDDFEASELAAVAVAVGVGGYLAYQAYKKLTQDANATITGAAPFVASGQPLTYPQAGGIAGYIGTPGGWQLSPDSMQIWFFDGSFYDNATGNYYDTQGKLVGNLKTLINSQKGCGSCIFNQLGNLITSECVTKSGL